MTPLYSRNDYVTATTKDELWLQCEHCKEPFKKAKIEIQQSFKPNGKNKAKYCSNHCTGQAKITKILLKCLNCDIDVLKTPSQLKKSKTGKTFCSKSCTTTYHNKNKTHGCTRSKLEIWIEEQLMVLLPDLYIDFNKKSAIGSELDIYIPSLNIAFELNGIFHYEPIFGINKLDQTKSNDISKAKACFDAKIDLCIIDTSAQKYVKPSTSQKYLDIIYSIILERAFKL